MTLYYFDFQDGTYDPDDVGTELETLADARREAVAALGEIASGLLAKGAEKTLYMHVREGADPVPVMKVRLMLSVEGRTVQ